VLLRFKFFELVLSGLFYLFAVLFSLLHLLGFECLEGEAVVAERTLQVFEIELVRHQLLPCYDLVKYSARQVSGVLLSQLKSLSRLDWLQEDVCQSLLELYGRHVFQSGQFGHLVKVLLQVWLSISFGL
jgi:hypothetical protein